MIPAMHAAQLSRKNVMKTALSVSLRPTCGFVNKATQHPAMITVGRTIARLVVARFTIDAEQYEWDKVTLS
jgi:hypothetical protein